MNEKIGNAVLKFLERTMEQLKKYIELMKSYAFRFLEWSKTSWKEGTTGKLKAIGAWLVIILVLGKFFGSSDIDQHTCNDWNNYIINEVLPSAERIQAIENIKPLDITPPLPVMLPVK